MRKRIVAMLLTVALLMGVLPFGAVQSGRPGKIGNGAAALLHQNLEIRTELRHKTPTFLQNSLDTGFDTGCAFLQFTLK